MFYAMQEHFVRSLQYFLLLWCTKVLYIRFLSSIICSRYCDVSLSVFLRCFQMLHRFWVNLWMWISVSTLFKSSCCDKNDIFIAAFHIIWFVFKMGCFCETCILYCFLTTTLLEMWWPAIRALTLWHPCSFWSFIGPSGGMEAHDSERQQAKTLQCRGLFEICFNNNLHCLLHLFFIYCSLIHLFLCRPCFWCANLKACKNRRVEIFLPSFSHHLSPIVWHHQLKSCLLWAATV